MNTTSVGSISHPSIGTRLFGWVTPVKKYAFAHKVISGVVLVVFVVGGWFAYQALTAKGVETHYILGTVTRGTIVASVSESGQVSSTDSVDIKPQASGTITWVGVKAGDTVRAGQGIMAIDSSDAKSAIVDAQKSLQAAQLEFQKDSASAPISYQNDVNTLATAKTNLADDYNTTYNDVSDTYLDLPDLMNGVQNTLFGYDLDAKKLQWNMDILTNLFISQQNTGNLQPFKDLSKSNYTTAKDDYTDALSAYQMITRTSSTDDEDALLLKTTTLMTDLAQALQSELNFLGVASDLAQTYGVGLPSGFTTLQSNTRNFLSTTNGDLSTLLSQKKTLDSAKQSIVTAQQNITLDQVGNTNGDNPISLQISQNSLEKQEADLATQEADLANYTIVAPFAGTISAVNLKVGDSAGSAAAATIISKSQIAELSLNEVDAAKVSLGNKATLTFDAIDGLTLTGKVVGMDTIGTVSQGVVSYKVDIGFDSQDARVKPGMTVNASVETGVASNVLMVPSGAVKTVNGASYVLVFTPALTDTGDASGVTSEVPPEQVPVTTGMSDDTNVEITSGLTEGEQIVARTSTTAATASSATSGTGAAATGAAARGGSAGFGGGAALRL